MIYHYIKNYKCDGDHYAVADNSYGEVLLQIQDRGDPCRVILQIEEARHLMSLLVSAIESAEFAKQKHTQFTAE